MIDQAFMTRIPSPCEMRVALSPQRGLMVKVPAVRAPNIEDGSDPPRGVAEKFGRRGSESPESARTGKRADGLPMGSETYLLLAPIV
jgi:hypothetical protein